MSKDEYMNDEHRNAIRKDRAPLEVEALIQEAKHDAVIDLATKIADWPMEYDGPSPDQGEAESYYEIMRYCYSLIGRKWK